MGLAALCCLVFFIGVGYTTPIETEVRILVPNQHLQSVPACETLKVRAPENWASGVFANCTYDYSYQHKDDALEVIFKVEVDTSKLGEPDLPYDFQMWHLNRLLNGNEKRCLTVTGKGQKEDAENVSASIADHIPRSKFILVGPIAENICGKILNKRLNRRQHKITKCELLEKSKQPVDGQILGKYSLSIEENQLDFEAFQHHDIHIFTLRQLNGPRGDCRFNGYWAPLNFVEDGPAKGGAKDEQPVADVQQKAVEN